MAERSTPGSEGLAARALAAEVLLRVEREVAHADAVLAEALARTGLTPRDRGLTSRLVYGTLAWQGRLDWQLARLAARDLASIDPAVRVALRLGLYQLTLLDRVPDHAAVATSVEIVKRHAPAAASLVNAVLRRAIRERAALPLPDPTADPTEHLAVAFSHPRWLVERWLARFGAGETRALLATDNEAAPTVLRARRGGRDALLARLAAAGIAARAARFAPDAVHVDARDPHGLEGWSDGAFSVQSEASQLVVLALDVRPGMRVLDVCGAPGGKATYAAEIVGETGLLVAVDHRRRGAATLKRAAARLGLGNVAVTALDARTAGRAFRAETFDRVLVDAPCSGLGTLRAHPEIRWRRGPTDLTRLAATQRAMLAAVTPLVKRGGAVVYATCTLTEEENDGVVRAWLSSHPELQRETVAPSLPDAARALVDPEGTLVTLPHRDGLDGFFAVRARRG